VTGTRPDRERDREAEAERAADAAFDGPGGSDEAAPDEAAPDEAGDSDTAADEAADKAARARRRWTRFVVMGGVFAIGAVMIYPTVPREQDLRLHFGSGSSRVVRATARVARVVAPEDERASGREGNAWERETTWSFANGAPPSITWSFELPNGAADVEVEVTTQLGGASRTTRIELKGGETKVELAELMRALD
jgi:hypothetical protein